MAQQPVVGQSLLISEVSRLRSDTLHSVGLLDEGSAQHRVLYPTADNTHNRQRHPWPRFISMFVSSRHLSVLRAGLIHSISV